MAIPAVEITKNNPNALTFLPMVASLCRATSRGIAPRTNILAKKAATTTKKAKTRKAADSKGSAKKSSTTPKAKTATGKAASSASPAAKKASKKKAAKASPRTAKKAGAKKAPAKRAAATKASSDAGGTKKAPAASKAKTTKKPAAKKAVSKKSAAKATTKAPAASGAKAASAKKASGSKATAKKAASKKVAAKKTTSKKATSKKAAASTSKPASAAGKKAAAKAEAEAGKSNRKGITIVTKKRIIRREQPPKGRPSVPAPTGSIMGMGLSSGRPLIPSSNAPAALGESEGPDGKKVKSPFTKRQLDKYAEVLHRKRRELLGDIDSMENEALKSDGGASSSLPQHMADQGSDSYDQTLSLDLAAADRTLLKEIDAALDRIADKTYGICAQTGKPISKERLDELPWARFSIEAARAMERHGR